MRTTLRWQSGLIYLLAWLALGLFNASLAQAVTVTNVPPTVTLTAPAANQSYTAPASITLSATASDSDGTIVQVEFYNDTILLGTATAAPYNYTWDNVPAGSYNLSAKAYDNLGASTSTTPIVVTVVASIAPTVSLTSPSANQSYTAPANIVLSANATETGGAISHVDFYNGTSLLGTATVTPYGYTWNNVPAGNYTFTAVATDVNNVSTTSSSVSVSVGPAATTGIYYIYTDQLNTPRLITDTANTAVWRNDQNDPFNAGAANSNPSGLGTFTFNPRFPGQYYDTETGLHYNMARDYDPATGRYVQSDPIGLAGGGVSTYAYVGGDPISRADPTGLIWPWLIYYASTYAAEIAAGVEVTALIATNTPSPASGAIGSVKTIAQEAGAVQTFNNFRQARNSLSPVTGHDIHHVVEQCQAKSTRTGFPISQLNSTDNLMYIPDSIHQQISNYYSSRPPGFDTTVRNSLNGMGFQQQYEFGIDVVQRAIAGTLK